MGELWKSWLSVSGTRDILSLKLTFVAVFEDKDLADQAVLAVEKEIHSDAYDPTKQDVELGEKQVPANTV